MAMDEALETLPDCHPGVEDGTVDANGETVVHVYDEDGNVIGWHKLPAPGTEVE